MKFTGERMIPEFNKDDLIYAEHMARYFFAGQFVADKNVLDVASGSGYGTRYLLDKGAAKVVGIDNSREAIKYSREKYQTSGIEFILADAAKLPFKDNIFDIVVSFETIEHLDDQEKFLREIKRVIKKNGLLIISTPNVLVFPKGNTFHKKELAPSEFISLLSKNFRHCSVNYQHSILSSYVFGEKNLACDHMPARFENIKLSPASPDKNMYLVAIAGDGGLPRSISDLVVLHNNSELIKKDCQLKLKNDEIASLNRQIEYFRNTGFGKIAGFIHRFRKKAPIIKNLPGYFSKHK